MDVVSVMWQSEINQNIFHVEEPILNDEKKKPFVKILAAVIASRYIYGINLKIQGDFLLELYHSQNRP